MQPFGFRSFLKRYFSPESYLSVYLVMGLFLLLLSAWAFGSLAEDVVTNEPIVRFDTAVVNAIHANTSPTLIHLMFITSMAGSQLPAAVAVIMAIAFIWRRRWDDLLLLVVSVGGAQILNTLFKFSFHRLRPSFADPVISAVGFSFPSGHAMGAMVFYGLIAYLLMRDNKALVERVLITLIFLLIVGLVGFSRIYLGVHYPSDVLGGYVAGLAWLTISVSSVKLFSVWRRKRRVHN